MREIVFRGKRLDNGEWVYGDLRRGGYYSGDQEVYITQNRPYLINYPVDPKTVGQYTGLNDKNGKRIFEDDTLQHRLNVVEYCNGGFCINGDSSLSLWKGAEIIGNIHDNPELLEVNHD